MRSKEIYCVFHYVPLHNSIYAKKYFSENYNLPITENYADRIVRLPLWIGVEKKQDFIINQVINFLKNV